MVDQTGRRSNPLELEQNPLGRITLFAAIGQNPAGSFLKLALASTPDPIRSTRRGPDPNRPMYTAVKKGVMT